MKSRTKATLAVLAAATTAGAAVYLWRRQRKARAAAARSKAERKQPAQQHEERCQPEPEEPRQDEQQQDVAVEADAAAGAAVAAAAPANDDGETADGTAAAAEAEAPATDSQGNETNQVADTEASSAAQAASAADALSMADLSEWAGALDFSDPARPAHFQMRIAALAEQDARRKHEAVTGSSPLSSLNTGAHAPANTLVKKLDPTRFAAFGEGSAAAPASESTTAPHAAAGQSAPAIVKGVVSARRVMFGG